MGFETYPQNGGKKFDTVMHPAGWDDHDNGKRNRSKSGRNKYAAQAGDSYKVEPRTEAPGNTSRRDYPKKGNKYQNGFGTGA